MCQCIFLAEDSPYTYLIIYMTAIKLMSFHLFELLHELLVDGEVLLAVGSW